MIFFFFFLLKTTLSDLLSKVRLEFVLHLKTQLLIFFLDFLRFTLWKAEQWHGVT